MLSRETSSSDFAQTLSPPSLIREFPTRGNREHRNAVKQISTPQIRWLDLGGAIKQIPGEAHTWYCAVSDTIPDLQPRNHPGPRHCRIKALREIQRGLSLSVANPDGRKPTHPSCLSEEREATSHRLVQFETARNHPPQTHRSKNPSPTPKTRSLEFRAHCPKSGVLLSGRVSRRISHGKYRLTGQGIAPP